MPAIIELEEQAFESPQLTPDVVLKSMSSAAFYRVLEEDSTERIVGSLVGELREPGADTSPCSPFTRLPAAGPRHGNHALGTRAVQRSAAPAASTLTTNVDNAPAIALYRKLGFAPKEFGLDYRRPVADEEVRQILERNRAEHLSMRPRWSIR